MITSYHTRIEPGEDVIDTRDVIEAITRIEGRLEDRYTDEQGDPEVPTATDFEEWLKVQHDTDDEDATNLLQMRDLIDEIGSEARHGVTLISDDYFQTYAEELANDIGAIKGDGWPMTCIDWKRAAEELLQDYCPISYGGYDYWYRA